MIEGSRSSAFLESCTAFMNTPYQDARNICKTFLAQCSYWWFNAVMEDLVSAVRELRAALGDSQQSFAGRIGVSMRAVANYEKDRIASAKALYQLAKLASQSGKPDLAA